MIVIDNAALVDALTLVEGTDGLRAFMVDHELHAPMLLDFELVSALRGLVLGGHLTATRAHDVLTDFDDLPLRRWPSVDGLRRRAFQLRDSVTAYDAAYIALAEALDCPLLTRDGRLARSGGHDALVEVR